MKQVQFPWAAQEQPAASEVTLDLASVDEVVELMAAAMIAVLHVAEEVAEEAVDER